jgi:hypothetical protein
MTLLSTDRMELYTVHGISLVSNGGELGVLGSANGVKALGQVAEFVTMRHPHSHGVLEALKELVNVAAKARSLQVSVTIFARGSSNDVVSVKTVGDLLETVADTEDRDAEIEEGGIDMRGAFLVDGVRSARQNDTFGLPAQVSQLLGAWQHLGVNIDLAEATGDKVSAVYGAKLESSS